MFVSTRKYIGPLVILVTMITASGCVKSDNRVVAKVGRFEVLAHDVADRNRIMLVYQPEDTRELGLEQLTRLFTVAQVLENNGRTMDREALLKESQRIDSTTLAPDMLNKIKDVFKSSAGKFREDDYLKVYVLPEYAERVIFYEFFLNDEKTQKASLAAAHAFLAKVSQPGILFESVAKENAYPLKRFTVSDNRVEWEPPKVPQVPSKHPTPTGPVATQLPPHIKQKMATQASEQERAEARAWMVVARTLKAGQIFPQVINFNDKWLVAKISKILGAKYQMVAAMLPKDAFAPWYDQEQAKVKIERF